ncbi:polysaccharide lyase family 1 protein [Streptomyces sp. DSM 41972]|uniref:Polysaccharide lyase family 1 protein n=1 Tax=Streptomyces althioticus subsp. attaecolombicae TaxID=3075534 RepID=A0ABU3HSK6_9ACTN|nr:polysaccharide lyase family 1 protein [Streptomyces sp. DSM 41972]SCD39252.1 pectate lyase [Streptomyces sp. di188]SCD40985.1 pectate lyase [Streptomyces sp. di50b]
MNVHVWQGHARRVGVLAGCTGLALALTGTAAQAHTPAHAHRDPARQVLPAGDGWAAHGTGTTGGAAARAARVHTVTDWEELTAALAEGGDAPRIIKVKGTIDAVAEGCDAFAVPGYDFDAYLEAYDPETWGRDRDLTDEPDDSPEGLRRASAARQDTAIKVHVPSDTTIIGVGRNAAIKGASLQIKDVDNVIVRNLTLESPVDCFPQWDPTDGDLGNWNSEYDTVVVHNSAHVWLDHNTFTDGAHPDSAAPTHFGMLYQQHDGELDIVRGANYVTASWNVFTEHDKTILIGNSDSESTAVGDRGKLKATFHHNLFDGLTERTPRVRFGQVDVYNNHFKAGSGYGYSFGVGKESQLVAEHNAFTLAKGISPAKILKRWNDAPLTARHNLVDGRPVDLIAVHNAEVPEETLRSGAGWTPTLRRAVHPAWAVPVLVRLGAGAGRLG